MAVTFCYPSTYESFKRHSNAEELLFSTCNRAGQVTCAHVLLQILTVYSVRHPASPMLGYNNLYAGSAEGDTNVACAGMQGSGLAGFTKRNVGDAGYIHRRIEGAVGFLRQRILGFARFVRQ